VLSEIKQCTAPARTRPRAPESRACSVGHVPCTLGSGVRMPRRLRGGPKQALGRFPLSCRRASRSGKPMRPGSGPVGPRATARSIAPACAHAGQASWPCHARQAVLLRLGLLVCAHAFVHFSRACRRRFLPAARAVAPHYRAAALAHLRSHPPPPKLFPSFLRASFFMPVHLSRALVPATPAQRPPADPVPVCRRRGSPASTPAGKVPPQAAGRSPRVRWPLTRAPSPLFRPLVVSPAPTGAPREDWIISREFSANSGPLGESEV
jgi:hypothetical protein